MSDWSIYGVFHFLLGYLFFRFKKYAPANRFFRRATKWDPEIPKIWLFLGCSLKGAGEDKEAIAALSKVIELSPNEGMAYAHLGQIYSDQELFEKAIATYLKAVENSTPRIEFQCHFNLGNLYVEVKDEEKVIKHYQKAISLKPNEPDTYVNLGGVLGGFGRHEDAIRVLLSGIGKSPNDFSLFFNLGWVYEKAERFPDAVLAFEKCLEISPESNRVKDRLESLKKEIANSK